MATLAEAQKNARALEAAARAGTSASNTSGSSKTTSGSTLTDAQKNVIATGYSDYAANKNNSTLTDAQKNATATGYSGSSKTDTTNTNSSVVHGDGGTSSGNSGLTTSQTVALVNDLHADEDVKSGTTPAATPEAKKAAAEDAKNNANNAVSQAATQVASSSGDLNLSQYLPEMASKPEALSEIDLDTSDLDKWLASATEQSNNKIDYAVEQGVNEYNRAYEDALPQYQTQRNQVDINEAKAKDNQALYAEARGDKGGIGAAQYDTIMNTAMVQRREISTAQTKLATDTARSIADLRAQGEFEKADAILTLNQTYLSKLQELKQWTLEYNMSIQQFNAELEQWWENYKMEYAQLQMQVEEAEYNARQASIARAYSGSGYSGLSGDDAYSLYSDYIDSGFGALNGLALSNNGKQTLNSDNSVTLNGISRVIANDNSLTYDQQINLLDKIDTKSAEKSTVKSTTSTSADRKAYVAYLEKKEANGTSANAIKNAKK